MSHFDKIYEPWGGNAEAMAADIGELGVTVRQWRNRGVIRERYWRKIIAAARAKGFELVADDFLPDEDGNGSDTPEGDPQDQQAAA